MVRTRQVAPGHRVLAGKFGSAFAHIQWGKSTLGGRWEGPLAGQRHIDESDGVIELTLPIGIEVDPHGGGQLVLWTGKAFDFSTPFRRALTEIVETLGPESTRTLQIPPAEDREDFVEGSFRFNDGTVEVYWEHSLSYMSLKTGDLDALHEIVRRIRHVTVHT